MAGDSVAGGAAHGGGAEGEEFVEAVEGQLPHPAGLGGVPRAREDVGAQFEPIGMVGGGREQPIHLVEGGVVAGEAPQSLDRREAQHDRSPEPIGGCGAEVGGLGAAVEVVEPAGERDRAINRRGQGPRGLGVGRGPEGVARFDAETGPRLMCARARGHLVNPAVQVGEGQIGRTEAEVEVGPNEQQPRLVRPHRGDRFEIPQGLDREVGGGAEFGALESKVEVVGGLPDAHVQRGEAVAEGLVRDRGGGDEEGDRNRDPDQGSARHGRSIRLVCDNSAMTDLRCVLLVVLLALGLSGCPDDDDDSSVAADDDDVAPDDDDATDDDDAATDDDDVAPDDDDVAPDDDDATDDDDSAGADDDDSAEPVSEATTWTFSGTAAIFDNPERGFYRTTSLVEGGWFYDGYTLTFSYVRLDDYREADLPQSLLDDVQVGLDAARADGQKIILRVAYNAGPYPESEPDAPYSWVITHIDQLTPLLTANEDVIAVVQAGFIGAWGEWHTSTNDLLDFKEDILEALLDAVPATRMVQIRTPMHKNDIYGNVPFPAADAHTGVDHARVGHHNDCFLASPNDWGTYPSDSVSDWLGYTASETLSTLHGGETCNPNPPRSECASALAEMELLHTSYLNDEYHPDVLASWVAGGCRDEIERSLGYRFALSSGDVVASSDGAVEVALTLTNEGWAAPYNPRTAYLVVDGATGAAVPLGADPRFWLPGVEVTVTGSLSEIGPGTHELALWLPDEAPGLQGDPRYSIRLANVGTWDDTSGLNVLGTFVVPNG